MNWRHFSTPAGGAKSDESPTQWKTLDSKLKKAFQKSSHPRMKNIHQMWGKRSSTSRQCQEGFLDSETGCRCSFVITPKYSNNQLCLMQFTFYTVATALYFKTPMSDSRRPLQYKITVHGRCSPSDYFDFLGLMIGIVFIDFLNHIVQMLHQFQ